MSVTTQQNAVDAASSTPVAPPADFGDVRSEFQALVAAAGVYELSARAKVSFTSELLPEPLTPVTTQSTPSGNATSTFLRLCSRAPRTTS